MCQHMGESNEHINMNQNNCNHCLIFHIFKLLFKLMLIDLFIYIIKFIIYHENV